jgi:uncharacterized protein with NRDE domain
MCLILVAWQTVPGFPLVVAANRDEYHARPAARAAFWNDQPRILAGRDLEARGTWMGVARDGHFAAVTNYRGGREPRAAQSRGALVAGFLADGAEPRSYVAAVAGRGAAYSGFNLLAADGESLCWVSNRGGEPRRLEPGIYGLGNLLLDTPEVGAHKQAFARALEPGPSIEPLFSVLAAAKIVAPEYGTRCATVLIKGDDGVMRFAERAFDPAGAEGETVRFELRQSA